MKTEPEVSGRDPGPRPAAQEWVSIALAFMASLVVWPAEAALHHFVFGDREFLHALLEPTTHELWMRTLVTVLVGIIVFGWAESVRHHRREEIRLLEYQRQLRDITIRLAHGQNEAFRALSDRLHEDVAQSLAAGRLFLSTIENSGEPVPPMIAHEIGRILDRAMVDCRDIAKEMSPPSLEAYGLVSALETLAAQVMMRSGVSVEVSDEGFPELPRQTLLAIYHALAEIVAVAASNPATSTIHIDAVTVGSERAVRVSWDADGPADLLYSESAFRALGGAVTRSAADDGTVVILTPGEDAS